MASGFLNTLTLRQKIGQMIIGGFWTSKFERGLESRIRKFSLGGVIFYGKNIKSENQVRNLASQVQSTAENCNLPPLFVCVDHEGGLVNRFEKFWGVVPGAQELGKTKTTRQVERFAFSQAVKLKTLGFNVNFAPVLDVSKKSTPEFLTQRCFGNNPKQVAEFGLAFIKGTQKAKVLSVVKHFPGHGAAKANSHEVLPVVKLDFLTLNQKDLYPFKKVIEENCQAIMVGHLLVKSIDSKYPASFSKKVIEELLGKKFGFEGLIISDELKMGAVVKNCSLIEAALLAIKAGCDMILGKFTAKELRKIVKILAYAVKSGEINGEQIDESLKRIFKKKEEFCRR